ncbi:Hypothetical predicted protein [Mytilus galloprovincialis]|uniref:YqaJ viral recombinase domain-containing protein n=1 Tax=Mytilus galloprovincialis TaxID=29158 RepID=A0A8B6C7F4_MYTGA|nr:Hypothetical predicted protein [Mytilus galloprovincialis]
MGGSWERIIGIARKILNNMLFDLRYKNLTHEVLTTFMAEVFILRNECNVTVAKEQYAEKYKDNHIYDCGLVVNPGFSFLGAAPDGKLCSNGTTEIIEIKCRYAVRPLN